MCQQGANQRTGGVLGCTCGCCGCGPFFRRFISVEEEIERLEKYRDQLKRELQGVEERIQDQRSK